MPHINNLKTEKMEKQIREYKMGIMYAETRKGTKYNTEVNLLSDIEQNELVIEIIQFGQAIYIREKQFDDFVDILRAALSKAIDITENE